MRSSKVPDIVDESAGGSSIVAAITFPFRVVLGLVRTVFTLARVVLKSVQLPLRAIVGIITLIIDVASDITFGVWRVAWTAIKVVLGVGMFVLKRVRTVWKILGRLGVSITGRLGVVGTVIRVVVTTVNRTIALVIGTTLRVIGRVIGLAFAAVLGLVDGVLATLGVVVGTLLKGLGLKKRSPKTPQIPLDIDLP